ncbi:GNAT family N-acetyltransferase [Maribacter sp. MMG018]|uniref:GNAT family N-acetyltransferase n=1 Tax=Maribacter sp. MMG018 TaxID=2822688 RepID=UPI001B377DC3|nr:GNAT family N-acetyltransferase [Maribacter sp. MMG018]MBQ4915476.1 GNAT family N-acetyltransferase [Maribacter sp. MMG018]
MNFKSLESVNSKDILDVFNKSFADYFVPFKLTEDQLVSKMTSDKINFDLSVGVFENEKLIAFVLHGFDTINNQKVVYNGGTGVVSQNRGQGITKKMYDYVLPILKEKGIDKIVLEVISKNTPAIKSYEKVGFKITRELACFKGVFTSKSSNTIVETTELQNYDWDLMESFWDIHTTWQNSKNVLNDLKKDNDARAAYINGQLIGYAVYNPKSKKIQQIAIHKSFRKKGIATKLMSDLAEQYGSSFSVINVDKKSNHLTGFFKSLGFECYIEQLEMELDLSKN